MEDVSESHIFLIKIFVLFFRILCLNRYSKGFIFPIKNLEKAGMPITPKSLQEFLEKSCEHFRHRLVKEYVITY